MSFNNIYIYYQYSNCINKTNELLTESLETKIFDPIKCAELQLLSISLNDNNNDIFLEIKFILNIITSYLAAFSQSSITESDLELLILIEYILYILNYVLSYSYQELAIANNEDFTLPQVEYILNGPSPLVVLNSNLKISFYELHIDNKYSLLNSLKNTSIHEWTTLNILNK